MRKGDWKDLSVPGVGAVRAEYLGTGSHAVAFRDRETVFAYVFEEDEYMKDVLAEFCAPDSPHVPKVERLGESRLGRRECRVYRMPYYPTVTARDREAWYDLSVLKKEADDVFRSRYVLFGGHWSDRKPLTEYGHEFNDDVIEGTRGLVTPSVTDALEQLRDAASIYGASIAFEFGKRNVGVDARGRVVFRDVLFDAEKVARKLLKGWRR